MVSFMAFFGGLKAGFSKDFLEMFKVFSDDNKKEFSKTFSEEFAIDVSGDFSDALDLDTCFKNQVW